MSDDRVSQALRSLPREQASPQFKREVLHRLDVERARKHRWGLAAAALLALAIGLGWQERQHQVTQQQSTARLQALLAEKQALEEELRQLQALTAQARPVVYLGGNEEVDLVLDLARLRSRGKPSELPQSPAAVRPAYFSNPKITAANRAVY
ncbi:MAG: hypothetical protein AAF560_07955 [Acidobacteriota bacterium]